MKATNLVALLQAAIAEHGAYVEVYLADWQEQYAWPTKDIAAQYAIWHEKNNPQEPRQGVVLTEAGDDDVVPQIGRRQNARALLTEAVQSWHAARQTPKDGAR